MIYFNTKGYYSLSGNKYYIQKELYIFAIIPTQLSKVVLKRCRSKLYSHPSPY